MIPEIYMKMKDDIPWKLSVHSSNMKPWEMIEKARTMNIFDLWYIQMYYLGYSLKILISAGLLMIVLSIILFFYIKQHILNENG